MCDDHFRSSLCTNKIDLNERLALVRAPIARPVKRVDEPAGDAYLAELSAKCPHFAGLAIANLLIPDTAVPAFDADRHRFILPTPVPAPGKLFARPGAENVVAIRVDESSDHASIERSCV